MPTASSIANLTDAPVAQLDRVLASEAKGHWFESSRARSYPLYPYHLAVTLSVICQSRGLIASNVGLELVASG